MGKDILHRVGKGGHCGCEIVSREVLPQVEIPEKWTQEPPCFATWIWIWQLVGRAPGWGITLTGCACYGPGCLLSRLLRDAAESADATV